MVVILSCNMHKVIQKKLRKPVKSFRGRDLPCPLIFLGLYLCKILKMKKLILTACMGFIFQLAFCQTDYVITVKGDTLYGTPKIFSYDIVDRVQLTVDKKKKSYTAVEVREIFLNNERYQSVRHENRYVYMLLLKRGYLSLYGFRIEKQITYDGRYLVKRDGDAMDVPNLGFKKSMQEFLSDCQSVSEQVKSGELGRKNLDSLISLYNICIDQKSEQMPPKDAATEPTLPALETLRGKIENSSLHSKQDVLDLIKDIDNKVKRKENVPNYLIEGLKGYLANTEYNDDLEKLIATLPKK